MSRVPVTFRYYVGLAREAFASAQLVGSWDGNGRLSVNAWTAQEMRRVGGEDGGTVFEAEVVLAPRAAETFSWGVALRGLDGTPIWGIFAEVSDRNQTAQHRSFSLSEEMSGTGQLQTYHLTQHAWLGAQRWAAGSAGGVPAVRFAVWAPHARAVDVVFGGASGYIADDGDGADETMPPLPLSPSQEGVWSLLVPDHPRFVGRRYMFRVTRDDGRVTWSTDMYSREQSGRGDLDPNGGHFHGTPAELDGTPSCSVVVDLGAVSSGSATAPVEEFWADEIVPGRSVPRRLADLVIYELHVGALGPHHLTAGTFADAIALLPYLDDLGVNAVELLPMFEFNGTRSWGYGSSHFLAIESSAGGRDALKHFVKACHQRGIAVLMDVVYNHYDGDSARAAWQYDSAAASRNRYFWYEGTENQYPDPSGGYVDNVSSGFAPRYHDPQVRALFVSSAVMLVEEFHIDGLRVDQTTSMHSYNQLHADGRAVPDANIFGRKLLRELCQTLKAIRPDIMLIAEDHSGWDAVTQPATGGGLGFDAAWYVDFYHHLIGDKNEGPDYARLLFAAGRNQDIPLAMSSFATALQATSPRTVVYAENHDEAGNAAGTRRTIRTAVDDAPLVGATRRYAEARCRFAFGMTMLSAGVPMFLMGEEVGAEKGYTYDRFTDNKEDLIGLRAGTGSRLFRFYHELIALRRSHSALRSGNIQVLHVRDAERVLALRRWDDSGELLVVASLNNRAFDTPSYQLRHGTLAGGSWRECFNSDAARYGGDNVGNLGGSVAPEVDRLDVVVPANGFCVFVRQ